MDVHLKMGSDSEDMKQEKKQLFCINFIRKEEDMEEKSVIGRCHGLYVPTLSPICCAVLGSVGLWNVKV